MKNVKLIGFLMIALSSFMFIQCTSDVVVGPQGEAGIDGIDGINGTNGTNGTDGVDGVGTASCIACHSESHRDPIESSYAMSGHAAGGAVAYAGSRGLDRGSCAECHSNEGYIDYITTGSVAANGYANPTPISCTTCHDKHGTFDFENDGYDYALRSFGPVEMRKTGTGYTIDYGDKSNTCIECHQPRSIPRIDADELGIEDGLIEVPNRYGPHYGAQSILLEGVFGAEIMGSISYPTAASSTHRTGASCVSCHMGATTDIADHSMIPTANACATCHGDAESLVTNLKTEIDGLMTQLEVLFAAQGLLDSDGDLVYNVDYPTVVADAYWNYKFIYYDHSHGVHNPAYTRALLKNSIEALEAL